MKQKHSIQLIIVVLIFFNIVLSYLKFKDRLFNNEGNNENKTCLTISCENIHEYVFKRISVGDTQSLGGRILGKIINIRDVKKYPYRVDSSSISYNFILELLVETNLIKFTRMNLFSPVAFETDEYSIDGRLLTIEGGYAN